MFDNCLTCNRIGKDCRPPLASLPSAERIKWLKARQKVLGWTNTTLSEKSRVPLSTITRLWSGESYADARYTTIRDLTAALVGEDVTELPCQNDYLAELEELRKVAKEAKAKVAALEKESKTLKGKLNKIDEDYRKRIREIREEHREEVAFYREQLRAWQTRKD